LAESVPTSFPNFGVERNASEGQPKSTAASGDTSDGTRVVDIESDADECDARHGAVSDEK
jgi:hypothetical protein